MAQTPDSLPLVVARIVLDADEAAAALGLATRGFLVMVESGAMPEARLFAGRRLWDAEELRQAFRRTPFEGEEARVAIALAAARSASSALKKPRRKA